MEILLAIIIFAAILAVCVWGLRNSSAEADRLESRAASQRSSAPKPSDSQS